MVGNFDVAEGEGGVGGGYLGHVGMGGRVGWVGSVAMRRSGGGVRDALAWDRGR